jgi:hypothetical protein
VSVLLIENERKNCLLFFSALDYESWTANNYPNPFRFIVQCTILSDQSIHNIDFQLDLLDVNDNSPIFNQSIYQININENTSINTIVSTSISAYDIDSGVNGMFAYYLLPNSSIYSVSEHDLQR